MSEAEMSRKKRVRRSISAIVGAVALVCGSVAVPQANAYIQDDTLVNQHGDDLGAKPSASITLDLESDSVHAGQKTNALIRVDSEAPFPYAGGGGYGKSDVTALLLEIQIDPRLKIPLSASSIDQTAFKWSDGKERTPFDVKADAAQNAILIEFAGNDLGAAPGFELSLPVTVAEGLDPGTKLDVAVATEANIRPTLDWTYGTFKMPLDNEITDEQERGCYRPMTGEFSFINPGRYGTWLTDIWLGTNADYQLMGAPEVQVLAPGGEDYTAHVFRSPADPRVTDNPAGRPERLPVHEQDNRWLRRYEWKWNDNSMAGDTWIPEGAKVIVKQNVHSANCSFDPSTERFAAWIESRNAPLFNQDIARAQITVADPVEEPEPTTSTTTETTTETTTTTETSTTTAATTTVTPTETASTVTTTLTKTAPAVTTTPTETAPAVTTTSTETESETTTTTATSTETETATETTTATVTETEDCDCEPTTVTETTTVKEPVPTTEQVTTTEKAPERGTIGDRVWLDENGDGKEDPGEKTGVPGVTVVITDKDGNEIARTVTDEDGNWKVDVDPGEYTVTYKPGNYVASDERLIERTVKIEPGEENFDIDLGVLPGGAIGDRVWNDENGDGVQDEDEKGVPNVIVEVSREGGPTRTTYTDEQGNWRIDGLTPGVDYEIRFIKPEGWEVTGKVPGATDEEGLVAKATLKPKEYNDTYDLGLKAVKPDCDCEPETPGTIGDRVWLDENGDGKEDPGEKTGVPGVTVVVTDRDGNEVTRTVSDEDGNWKVDVTPGDYTVEYLPGGHTPSDPSQVKRTVTIEKGEKRLDVDLGVLPKGTVGDRVWNDKNGDGVQDEDEKGLSDVTVQVIRDGEPTRTTTTDKDGNWFIEGLDPNKEYEVRFIKPEGWEVTGKVPGATDEEGLISKVTLKPGERNDSYDLGLRKTKKIVEEEPTVPATPTPGVPSAPGGVLDRCVANAVASPILYLVPVALLAAVGGQVGAPYMDVINQQVAQINAEIQAQFSRNTPDWGTGNRGNDNDQFGELRAQIDAANRQLQQLAADPNVRQVGTIAAAILGVAALGGVLYDWCSNEKGEAFTSLKGSSAGKQD